MSNPPQHTGRVKIKKEYRNQTAGKNGQTRKGTKPEWWTALPYGERWVISSMVCLLRTAKRSRFREVAVAAAKWERTIIYFIKLQLMNGYAANSKRGQKGISMDTSGFQKN